MEHLDVPALVHDLGAAVELAVQPAHRGRELGRREQRALLAVQELGERPGEVGPFLLDLLGGARLAVAGQVGEGQVGLG
jgi:hypothetical protein